MDISIDPKDLLEIILTVIGTVIASSGFWAFIQHKSDKEDAIMCLLRGMAHDSIVSHGLEYIRRGWVTKDEYNDFVKYLYEPYSRTGGNGLAKKIFNEVSDLPIHSSDD